MVILKYPQAIEENNEGGTYKSLKELLTAKMEDPAPVFNGALPIHNKWQLPELRFGQNPEVPSFSSAASVMHSEQLGRHLIANREIDTGNFSNR